MLSTVKFIQYPKVYDIHVKINMISCGWKEDEYVSHTQLLEGFISSSPKY